MSYKQSLRILKYISEDHDIEVQMWADEMQEVIKEATPQRHASAISGMRL